MIRFLVLLLGLLLATRQMQAQTVITLDSIQDVSCPTSSDGGVFITAVGIPPLSYQWSTGATTQDLTGVISGSYRVTVTDGNGASVVSSFYTINAPPALNVNTDTIINILCAGDSTGAVDITVLGGTAPYTYLWQNGATTEDVTGLPAGPVGLTVTDANGCISSPKSIAILEPAPLVATLDSLQNILCNGDNNGAIMISASGGTSPLSFAWSNGATTEDLMGLAAGSYTLTITDSNSCQLIVGPYTITEPTALTVVVDSITTIDCNNNSTGGIYITASGGTGNYTYFWTLGFGGEDYINLNAGTYQVTVTDANGCTANSTPQTLANPTALVADSVGVQNISCNGAQDGAIVVQMTGGTLPYNYNWNTGDTSSSLDSLAAGSYTLTVTDNNNCPLVVGPITIIEPTLLTFNLDSFYNVSCNSAMDGAIFTTVTGGTLPYTYNWSNGDTLGNITRLNGGTYSVTVTDSSGCVINAGPFVIREPAVLTAVVDSVRAIACNGGNNGFINISVGGGNAPYSYNWSTGDTIQDLINLSGGLYSVTVTDSSSCIVTIDSILVNESPALGIQLDTLINATCAGFNDGQIFITTFGGTAPYSYSWNVGAGLFTEDISNLPAGIYRVIVTDSLGCTFTGANYTITEPSTVTITLDSLLDVSCNGAMDGAIYTSFTGGTAPYTYLWNNGDTLPNITRLNGGVYSGTMTDANGCTYPYGPFTVREPAVLTAVVDSAQDLTCNADSSGFINISVGGGNPPYSYNWNTGDTLQDLSGLLAGSYTLTVTDSSGCIVTVGPTVISEPLALVVDSTLIQNVSCNGAMDGSITLTLSGGTTPYTFAWNNNATTQNLINVAGGNYQVTITDNNGCITIANNLVIAEPTALVLTLDSLNDITCNGDGNGGIYTSVNGGTSPYTYLWSNGDTTNSIDSLQAGTYGVTVTDANNCTATLSNLVINEPAPIVITLDSLGAETCFNSSMDGFIDVSATGGTGLLNYGWTDSALTIPFALGDSVGGLSAGTYAALVVDTNFCFAVARFTIGSISNLQLTVDSVLGASCFGANDGAIYLTTSNGVGSYSYLWDRGDTTEDVTGLVPSSLWGGSYNITVTDSLGCTLTQSFFISTPPQLVLTLDSLKDISCNGAQDGSIALTLSGGNTPYTYNWSGGQTTEDLINLGAGTNSITVTDNDGCTITGGPYTINEPTALDLALTSSGNLACFGDSTANITTTITGGTPSYSYNWNQGQFNTPDLSNLTAGTYSLVVTDANGCTIQDSVVINQPDSALMVTINPLVAQLDCDNLPIGELEALATGGSSPYGYSWSNAANTALIAGLPQGTYVVRVTDDSACTAIDSFTILPSLQPSINPFIGQAGTQDTTVNWGSTVAIDAGNDQSSQGVTYNWQTISTLSNANVANANAASTTTTPEPATAGRYQFLLTATSADGCVDTASVYLEVELREYLGMPNAFSPNGDGINDFYRPANIDPQFVEVFRVYNRWGQLLYDGTEVDNQWDGTYQGQEQPMDVYIYYLEYQQPGQEGQQLRGEFTLIR